MTGRVALVLGGTGLVGSHLWQELVAAGHWQRIVLLTRRSIPELRAPVESYVIDFEDLPGALPEISVDDLFICMGTTMAAAGSREVFRRVDHDYPVSVAGILAKRGLRQLHLVTALGSNERSRFFYNRVKGDVEQNLLDLGVEATHCYRPSLLLGQRAENRPAEALAQRLLRPVRHLGGGPLGRWVPIEAKTVAKAMVQVAQETIDAPGRHPVVIPSDRIRKLAI